MKLKFTTFQKVIEILTLFMLVAQILYIVISWSDLPNKIPAHYNGAGEIDRWGSKNEILFTPIMNIFLYGLITLVTFIPSMWNVPTKVVEENKEAIYKSTRSLLVLMKFEIVASFFYVSVISLKGINLGSWFTPVVIIAIFGTIIYYTVKVVKMGKVLGD